MSDHSDDYEDNKVIKFPGGFKKHLAEISNVPPVRSLSQTVDGLGTACAAADESHMRQIFKDVNYSEDIDARDVLRSAFVAACVPREVWSLVSAWSDVQMQENNSSETEIYTQVMSVLGTASLIGDAGGKFNELVGLSRIFNVIKDGANEKVRPSLKDLAQTRINATRPGFM